MPHVGEWEVTKTTVIDDTIEWGGRCLRFKIGPYKCVVEGDDALLLDLRINNVNTSQITASWNAVDSVHTLVFEFVMNGASSVLYVSVAGKPQKLCIVYDLVPIK